MGMEYLQFTVELPQDLVDGIKELGDEMERQSGVRSTIEVVIAVLVVQGFKEVTTEITFDN